MMRYREDRIPAVEYEGRKYRSSTLLTRAMADADRREKALTLWNARARMLRLSSWMGWMFVTVAFVGFSALLDSSAGSGPARLVPPWFAGGLVIVGLWGFILSVRLDHVLQKREFDEQSAKQRLSAADENVGTFVGTADEERSQRPIS
jgi:hypothetical protein